VVVDYQTAYRARRSFGESYRMLSDLVSTADDTDRKDIERCKDLLKRITGKM
jgi:hypothetical protein